MNPNIKKRSLLRRILRRLAFYVVFVVFYIPTFFSKKMTEIPGVCDEGPLLKAFDEKYGGICERAEFREPETGLKLRGIFLPAAGGDGERCAVVFCHGLGGTKAQLMPAAEFIHEMGHDLLLFDLRGHGESEGNFTSLGYFEALDALAACEHMRSRGAKKIVLYGFSMGAVAAALAAARDESVAGLIAESPFDTLENIVAYKAREHYRLPKWPVITLSLWATEVRRNFDRREVDLTKALPRLANRAVLLTASTGDKTIPVEMTRRLASYLSGGHEYWEVDGVDHGAMMSGETGREYRERIRSFLARCNGADRG